MEELLLNELLSEIKDYLTNKESLELIKKAYFVAKEKHEGQFRKGDDGIPYITHPVAVAIILSHLHAGPQTIAAALLHDTLEDTDYTEEEMQKDFGKEIYELVYGVTKIGRLKFKTDLSQAEYHRKMLLAMASDMRVILIKLADRLHNIRTLQALPDERRKAISNETLEIYSPLAHRLGLFAIKAELEDTSLKYNDPEMYYYVSSLIQKEKSERQKGIDEIIEQIKALLKKFDVTSYSIKGRIKNINSIYKKMVIQERDFEDIYDLLAIRVIVKDIETCYKVLGIVHANYKPIPKRFKDYIAMPKPNMYQSLHTTVLSQDSNLFEVQIRTEEMDKIAEYGIAAHWAYKESKTYSKENEQFEMAKKMKWYADLLQITHDTAESKKDPISFVQDVKSDILLANVYVFTPNGKVLELPPGSTAIDFAYKIHTDVGNTMVGCLINNKIAPIYVTLKTGDIVSIKTSKNAFPSIDWLKVVKSSYAKNKIKAYFNKKNYNILVEQGKKALEREMTKNSISDFPDNKFVKHYFKKQKLETIDALLLEIGKGILSEKTVVAKIIGTRKEDETEKLAKQIEKARRLSDIRKTKDSTLVVPGLSSPKLKLANCCTPIYGEDVQGFVSKVGGIVVHTAKCPNVDTLDKKRSVEVFWGKQHPSKTYQTWLVVNMSKSEKTLPKVINQLSVSKVSLLEIKSQSSKKLGTVAKIKILVKDYKNLSTLISNLRKIENVVEVQRGVL